MESSPLPAPELLIASGAEDPDVNVRILGLAEGDESRVVRSLGTQAAWLQRLVSNGTIRGKKRELTLVASPIEAGPSLFLIVGLGRGEKLDRELAFDSGAAAIRKLSDRQRGAVLVSLGESLPAETHDSLVAGVIFGCEGQGIYQSESTSTVPPKILFSALDEESLRRGEVLGQSINITRRLVNEPASVLYPDSFARRAGEIVGAAGVSVEVWDETKLAAEGCRAMLAVGEGSSKKPRLLILRHEAGGDEPPIALVGKGVTFDSGGLSLKPSEGMVDMKCDMAGAATVVGVMHAIARLGLPRNVIGLCGLAENMVSGDSYKLGDVIKTRSGKTIEILNTDAEGRVVLADTLDVAISHEPSAVVDLATLTGACVVALGTEVAGLMTNDQSLCDRIRAAAKDVGEPVWQLPMFELYDEKVKSLVADIKNIGDGRWGGAITAAKFLERFVGDSPWVHLDIAGPAFAESAKPHRDAGATGAMVRTLVRWLETASGKKRTTS